MTEHDHDNSESDQDEDDVSRLTSENTKINARRGSHSIRTLASITELSTSLSTEGRLGQDPEADKLQPTTRDSTDTYNREVDHLPMVTFSDRTKKTNQNLRSRELDCGELLTAQDRHEWWSRLDPASRKPPPLEEMKVEWWNDWREKRTAKKKRKAQEESAISDASGSAASRRSSENLSESPETQSRKRSGPSDESDSATKTSASSIQLSFRQRTETNMPMSATTRENDITEQSRTLSVNESREESSGTSTLYPHDAERKLRRGRRFSWSDIKIDN